MWMDAGLAAGPSPLLAVLRQPKAGLSPWPQLPSRANSIVLIWGCQRGELPDSASACQPAHWAVPRGYLSSPGRGGLRVHGGRGQHS